MQPFKKTINNSARDKCIPSPEWRLENWPLPSNHLMTPKRAGGGSLRALLLLPLSAPGSIKRNSLLKEGHLQTLLNGGRQSSRVTPFWYRTRVMKKELASEARAHESAQPRAGPLPPRFSSQEPRGWHAPMYLLFPPTPALSGPPPTPARAPSLLRASPLPSRPSGPPSACIQPLS